MKRTMMTLALTLAVAAPLPALASEGNPVWLENRTEQRYDITVYRAESCGCCKGWIDHLRDHNFQVEDVVMEDVNSIKEQHGVPPQGASCHTAVVNGKVVEGHVPAQDIKRLLASDNNIRLLTVPGMPSGGPGMDWEGARQDAFKVFAVTESNEVEVYSTYDQY